MYTSSTRTRRGGSCLKDIYKTFLIYRTCVRRAPAKPVRACTLRKWCPVSHVTFEAPLRPSHFSLHSSHSTLHTSHFTLHTSHFTLHSPQSTLHTSHSTLHTSHFTLHSPHFTLLTSHCFLHTPHFTLHTALFTPHTSHCTLHTPRFISSELFSPYPSSSLLISSLLICHLSFHESLPSTTTKELACAVRQPGPCVRALREAVAVLLSKNMTCARPRYNANTFLTCTTKLAQTTSQYLLLCTTKLAQSTPQYYRVLQSLHKLLPGTTLYYKACTKHVPALLCTTKLAQSTSQYYCVLQSLHKTRSSTTLYYKACTKHVPVLLCTTKLLHTSSSFAEKLLHTASFSSREAFTQKLLHTTSFFTEKLSHTASVYTQNTYTQCFYTWQAFTHRNFCTETLLHTEKLLHTIVLRCSAAKDNSITHAAAAPSNLDAATTMRSAETELQNTIELRATVSQIAASKPDGSRRQSRKKAILKHF